MRDIQSTLRSLGITRLYKGYNQLYHAISIAVSNNDGQKLSMRYFLDAAASHTNSNRKAVERNFRTLAARAWKINPSLLSEMAGHPLSSAPSSSDLIESISVYVLSDD